MGLIIETGAGVANANAYGVTDANTTLAAVRSYALNRGIVLSAVDADVITQLILACDFLESFSDSYVGTAVDPQQALSWPRTGVQFSLTVPFPSNALPVQLLQAEYEAVIAQFQGIVLQPNRDFSQGGYVLEEKVDVLLTKYSEKIGTSSEPLLPKVMAKLNQLLVPTATLQTVRI